MKKEVKNHKKHIEATFERLLELMFSNEEFDTICSAPDETIAISAFREKSVWLKTVDLCIKGVNTEKMAIMHLMWLQRVGRIVIEDIDPLCGVVRLHISFDDLAQNNSSCPKC